MRFRRCRCRSPSSLMMRPEDSRTIALCVEAVVHHFSIPQAAQVQTGPPNRHSQGKAPLNLVKRLPLFNPRKDADDGL